MIDKFVECTVPVSKCNLKCEYCYIMQEGRRDKELPDFAIDVDTIGEYFNKDRWHGTLLVNLCGAGETLLCEQLPSIVESIAKEGHFINITNNGTVRRTLEQILSLDKSITERVLFSFSLHYIELKDRQLLNQFAENVNLVKSSSASFIVQLNLCDKYIEKLDEIKQYCFENFNALPQVALTRREENEYSIYTDNTEQYIESANEFKSPLFEMTHRFFNRKQKYFCYAGVNSYKLDLATGDLRRCYFEQPFFNIYANEETIPESAVGYHCGMKYCINSSHFISLGDVPAEDCLSYVELRNRDNANWIKPFWYKNVEGKFKVKQRVYLIGVPEHGNLGDHEIASVEVKYLKSVFCEAEIVEISVEEYWRVKHQLKKEIGADSFLFFTGGGNLGNLWEKNEIIRQDAIQTWPLSRKIIFSQSIYFTNDENGEAALTKAKYVYANSFLYLMCRDKTSYKIAKREFACHSYLIPDMVLFNEKKSECKNGKYILMCFRRDKEVLLSDDDRNKIKKAAEESGYELVEYDTVLSCGIEISKRDKNLDEAFSVFSEAALVITDRLHGMIFSALCGKSCIVFSNSYHKVKEQADWLKDCPNIHKCESIDEGLRLIESKNWENEEIVIPNLRDKFIPLTDLLKNMIVGNESEEQPLEMAKNHFDRIIREDEGISDRALYCIAGCVDYLPDRKSICEFLKYIKSKDVSNLAVNKDTEIYRLIRQLLDAASLTRDADTDRRFRLLKASTTEAVKVSVVVPVYNVKPWLKDCLDSLCNQTLKDIEIICIDDESTDGSLEYLLELAEEDDRISVYTQKNSGLSAVRNRGISVAKGEYIHFMDSDDMLDLKAYEELYKKAEKEKLDVLVFAGHMFKDEGFEEVVSINPDLYSISKDYSIRNGSDLLVDLIDNDDLATISQMKFVRLSYLKDNKIGFYDGILHEDNIFTLQILLNAVRAAAIENQYFARRLRADSIMTRLKGYDHIWGYYICYREMEKELAKFAKQASFSSKKEESLADFAFNYLNNARGYYRSFSGYYRNWVKKLIPGMYKREFVDLICRFCELQEEVNNDKEIIITNREYYQRQLKVLDNELQKNKAIQAEERRRLWDNINELKETGKKLELEKRYYKQAADKGILGRIDIQCPATNNANGKFCIKEIKDSFINVSKPQWLQKNGKGFTLESVNGEISAIFECPKDSNIDLSVRGVNRVSESGERLPVWTDCTYIGINGENILEETMSLTHDKSLNIQVKPDENGILDLCIKFESPNRIIEENAVTINNLRIDNENLIADKEQLILEKDAVEQYRQMLENSGSYKIGRIITHLPRKIRSKIKRNK